MGPSAMLLYRINNNNILEAHFSLRRYNSTALKNAASKTTIKLNETDLNYLVRFFYLRGSVAPKV